MSSYVTEHMEPAMTLPPPPLRTARYGAYAGWQLRDYLIEKGIGTAITMLFFVLLLYVPMRATLGNPAAGAEQSRAILTEAFSQFCSWTVLLGALFATNGIVSDDRKNGYYRFLFAKPVNVARFYVQKFVVHLVGFLIVAALLCVAFNLVMRPHVGETFPFFPPATLPVLAATFVALGGIGFLTSAAWRVDWLSFMTVYIASSAMWTFFEKSKGWPGRLVHMLPPVNRFGAVYDALAARRALPMDDLAWLTIYGLACFVLGVVVVRKRALATS